MLSACDYVGESLANFLGITAPKYQYEIDEYNRAMEEVIYTFHVHFFCLRNSFIIVY